MEERTRWKPLISIDLPPPLVEPGKDSREKDIQYAREKGILQALYFNRSMYVYTLDFFFIKIKFNYACETHKYNYIFV